MKKVLLPVVFIVSLFSCKKQTNIDAVIGENTIEAEQCLVNIKGQNMSVCFDGLEQDSRCPANAMCISRGIAVANFTATYSNATVKFKLGDVKTLSGYPNDTTINNVHFTLKSVTPWPGEADYNLKKKKIVLDIQ
jgi:hypothetical protein